MNYMKQVANVLGVELDEEFKIDGYSDNFRFRLTKKCIEISSHGEWASKKSVLCNLLSGDLKLIKIPKSILTQEEKEYLSYVIKPFRDKVEYVRKYAHIDNKHEWIEIVFTNIFMCFPFFEKGTMYKGMELNKEYSVEELGI